MLTSPGVQETWNTTRGRNDRRLRSSGSAFLIKLRNRRVLGIVALDGTHGLYTRIMRNMLKPATPVQVLHAPPAVAIEEFLQRNRRWVEAAVGCPLAEAITFEFHLPFDHLVLTELFAGLPLDNRCISYTSVLRPIIDRWETPPDSAPRIELCISRDRSPGVAKGKFGWDPHWKDTPIAVWLKGQAHAFVYGNVPYVPHTDKGSSSRSILIVNKREMPDVLRIVETIEPPKRISMMAGRDIPLEDGYRWESVVLNPDLERFVRQDFESFFRREEWFHRHHLPYRRGYLFYGPPGNGKTSAARVMASHPAIRAFGIDFRAAGDTAYGPEQLSELFDAATAQAPSLVVLEDIDKVGAGDPEVMRHAVNGLLSCMDGLTTEDGVIVVATANDPAPLGTALLKRPGRFDRMARFPMPAPQLRRQFLISLSGGNLTPSDAAEASLAMDRFSFAQVRETYILAGQLAFEAGDEITATNLAQAAKQLRREGKRVNSNGHDGFVGFSVAEDQVAVS